MTRRELLISMLQALLLALFPWLRTEHGVERLHEALDASLPNDRALFKADEFKIEFGIKGFEINEEVFRGLLRGNPEFRRLRDTHRFRAAKQLITIGIEEEV